MAGKKWFYLLLLGLFVLWMLSIWGSMLLGVIPVSNYQIFSLVRNGCQYSQLDASSLFVLCSVRLPRVLLSGLSGCILSLCGAVMQGLFRTPLADPYLLGVLGGATSGAALFIFLGLAGSLFLLSLGAFLGGILATVFVLIAASRFGKGTISTHSLILSGIACSALFSAWTSCFVFLSPHQWGSQSFIFWLLGSFSRSQMSHVYLLVAGLLCASPFLFLGARRLNLLSLGDAMALHLGLSPSKLRVSLLLVTTLLTALVVSCVGPIGFVGLLVPHLAGFITGSDYVKKLPVAALLGAIFLTWCDTLSRVLFAPALELPIGIITAILGAPFLLLLLKRQTAGGGHGSNFI